MEAGDLMAGVLRAHAGGSEIADVMAAALRAVDPGTAVRHAVRRRDGAVEIGGRRFTLSPDSRVIVLGAGKAGAPMARAVDDVLGDRVADGAVIVKDGHRGIAGERIGRIALPEASHPVPDERGVRAATGLAELARAAGAGDLVLVLISGGGSALMTLPAEGLTLADVRSMTHAMLRAGATIHELNAVRKHCLVLGGGGLARLAAPAHVVSLIISDVVGTPLDVIASGPTAPDTTTFDEALSIVERHGLRPVLPAPIVEHLERGAAGDLPETLKPGAPLWSRVHNVVVAENRTAAEAALAAARQRGLEATLLTTFLEGEAREVGRVIAGIAREMARGGAAQRRLLVAGGETTVTVRGDGLGGRNLEVALGAVHALAGLGGVVLVTLATDGGDGPTDAAGAVVTGDTLERARALGLDPHDYLRRNDAYRFFEPLDALLRPGPTLTNVNDLLFLWVGSGPSCGP